MSRLAGVAISGATALVVFAAGSALWPSSQTTPVLPPPSVAVVPTAPPPVAPPPAPAADAAAGIAPDGEVSDIGADAPAALAASADDAAARNVAETDSVARADGSASAQGSTDAESAAGDAIGTKRERASKRRRREKAALAAANAAKNTGADGGAVAVAASDASGTDSKRENSPLPPSDGTAPGAEQAGQAGRAGQVGKDATPADCALPEKEMARESWRRNWPAICPLASGKAFILIPIKGSIEGETHALVRRPTREARVILPAGSESLLTMKQYKVRRLGFKELRVNVTEGGGTRLRVKLQAGAGDPVFEVKDGYAKITVAATAKN